RETAGGFGEGPGGCEPFCRTSRGAAGPAVLPGTTRLLYPGRPNPRGGSPGAGRERGGGPPDRVCSGKGEDFPAPCGIFPGGRSGSRLCSRGFRQFPPGQAVDTPPRGDRPGGRRYRPESVPPPGEGEGPG